MQLDFYATYELPGYGTVRIIEFSQDLDEAMRVTFRRLSTGDQTCTSLSAFIDMLAEEEARKLFAEGWHCISGKHLTIARLSDNAKGTLAKTYTGERLKTYLRKVHRFAECKTVDVDTYVALKKLHKTSEVFEPGGRGAGLRSGEVAARLSRRCVAGEDIKAFAPVQIVNRIEPVDIFDGGPSEAIIRKCMFAWASKPPRFPLIPTDAKSFVQEYEARCKGRDADARVRIFSRMLRKYNADTLDARAQKAADAFGVRSLDRIRKLLTAGELK
jgi:hypothetical protein